MAIKFYSLSELLRESLNFRNSPIIKALFTQGFVCARTSKLNTKVAKRFQFLDDYFWTAFVKMKSCAVEGTDWSRAQVIFRDPYALLAFIKCGIMIGNVLRKVDFTTLPATVKFNSM